MTYADKLTVGLEKQFGSEWWLLGASPQNLQDYARQTTETGRKRVRAAMEAQTRQLAHDMIRAGLMAGVVTDVE